MADSSTTGNISLDCDFFGNFCKCVRNLSGCATDLKFEDQFNKVYACFKGPVFAKLFSNKWVIGAVSVIFSIVSAIWWIVTGTAGDDKRWIENERNLLSSLEDDVKDVLDSGSPIYDEALTLWQTEEHSQEKRARLKDSEEKWREKNKTLAGEVDSLFRDIDQKRKNYFYRKFIRSDDLVFLRHKNEIQEVKSKLEKHQNDSKAEKIDIYGTVDKLRPKIRILQDRPIDVGRKADVKQVDKGIIDDLIDGVREVDNRIGELLLEVHEVDGKNNDNLDDIEGEIQLFTLHLALVRAFLTDLRTFGSKTETKTENIWLEEAKQIVDELQQAIENFKKNAAKGRAEEAVQATENSKANDQTVDERKKATKGIVEEAPQATENSKQEPANDQTVDERKKATKEIVEEAPHATENSKQEPANDQTVDEQQKATKGIVDEAPQATENSKSSKARSELGKEMKRINTRFSESLERKKRFNVQFTRSIASREKDTSKSSGSENSQGQASEVRTSDEDLNNVLDEEKLINKYGIALNVSVEELKQLCDRFKKLNNTIKNAKDKEAIKSSTEERSNQMNKLAGKMIKYLDISQENSTSWSFNFRNKKKLPKNFEQIKGALDILELTTEAYSIGIREEMRAVGLDKDIKDVVSDLKSGEFRVVWIVGMMGIGKTTLAKNIYLHDDIVRHFLGRDWVTLTDKKAKQEENGGGDWRNKVCQFLSSLMNVVIFFFPSRSVFCLSCSE